MYIYFLMYKYIYDSYIIIMCVIKLRSVSAKPWKNCLTNLKNGCAGVCIIEVL